LNSIVVLIVIGYHFPDHFVDHFVNIYLIRCRVVGHFVSVLIVVTHSCELIHSWGLENFIGIADETPFAVLEDEEAGLSLSKGVDTINDRVGGGE
jgi:hypothetical protein